ncbi:uncharacterized protein LOC127135948 [Lathyrus oleraceus]|uniref:uncharacterized protein LOC127135948 n=1 Tax=Pisum sativum TaxID=3888 RepID=UPI0021D3C6E3|nr:uncharacterized protein LOC127135948 [Pisum sativum]
MAPYEALYGRKRKTHLCWTEVGEEIILGLEIIQETTKKIRMVRDKIKKAQDRQKSYADNRRRPLEFNEGLYQIIERISEVAYRLALLPSLSEMHDVFHVSQLQKFIMDSLQPILPGSIEVEASLTLEPLPNRIVGPEIKVLRNKEIPLVKVQWDESYLGDATWELESEMREVYP